jgi:hypothetical protein
LGKTAGGGETAVGGGETLAVQTDTEAGNDTSAAEIGDPSCDTSGSSGKRTNNRRPEAGVFKGREWRALAEFGVQKMDESCVDRVVSSGGTPGGWEEVRALRSRRRSSDEGGTGAATGTGSEIANATEGRFNGTRGTGSAGRAGKAETDGATVFAVAVATKGPSAQYAPEE